MHATIDDESLILLSLQCDGGSVMDSLHWHEEDQCLILSMGTIVKACIYFPLVQMMYQLMMIIIMVVLVGVSSSNIDLVIMMIS